VSNEVIVYTDGACLGNPGPGGWAAVLIWGGKRKELSGGFRLTTNNRMEILAAIEALKAINSSKKFKIKLHSDSRLLINAVTQNWLTKWQAKGWMRNHKDKVLNPDLWKQLLEVLPKHDVEFIWVEGHAGIPENERCDVLSKAAAQQSNLPTDKGYELESDPKLLY